MASLVNCINKVYGKLITKADADSLMRDAEALEKRGMTPIQAERKAVQDALEQATAVVRHSRPDPSPAPASLPAGGRFLEQGDAAASNRCGLPRFVTEGVTRAASSVEGLFRWRQCRRRRLPPHIMLRVAQQSMSSTATLSEAIATRFLSFLI